ncbi:transporter [Chitinispirillum alkaliphilum]|nr:transporter [Chitinispirillum alkaliphilum]
MDSIRIFEVLRVIFPVFAIMGLGKILFRKKLMNKVHQEFLNDIAYYIALPALIFVELAVQPFDLLLDPVLIFAPLLSLGAVFIVFTLIALVFKIKGPLAAPLIFGTVWANVAYMGFPLVSMAFEDEKGLAMAAIINAIPMPVFVVISFVVMGLYNHSKDKNLLHHIRPAVVNPIIIASALGLLSSFILSSFGLNSADNNTPQWVFVTGSAFHSFLQMIGTMGLPLALLSVGGTLSLASMGKNVSLLLLTVFGKLLLAPFLTYLIIVNLFPGADKTALGVSVLLMATPVAVATSVVSPRFNVNSQFVLSLLAVSTLLSSITMPFWLYILL